jgi:methylmalonyl-CoA epimerase
LVYELDHIGVAVSSIEEGIDFYCRILGFEHKGEEVVETEKVKVAGLKMGPLVIELLEPTSEDSVIKKFLDKKGNGIHHVCLRVENLNDLILKMKREGIQFVGEAPRPGAGGTSVAFIHPRQSSGLLIELKEKKKECGEG